MLTILCQNPTPIPLLLGTMRDDGAFFLPDPGASNLIQSLQAAPLSLSSPLASSLATYTNIVSVVRLRVFIMARS